MSDKNPPAFPYAYETNENGSATTIFSETGMTLRDYFAAAALQGLLAGMSPKEELTKDAYKWCYLIAEAMLEARNAGA